MRHAVIMAGGVGERFWPLSRRKTPKQLLSIVGKTTMIEETVGRLAPLIPAERIWIITNQLKADIIRKLIENDQIVFRYCDKDGKVTDESNPNGSLNNIAGICNEGKNVFGMMPHPERAVEDILNSSDGLKLFESVRTYYQDKVAV